MPVSYDLLNAAQKSRNPGLPSRHGLEFNHSWLLFSSQGITVPYRFIFFAFRAGEWA